MRTMDAVKADIQAANESLRTMFPKGNLDGIDEAKRGEFDALNEKIRALDTEAEEVMAAADAEAKQRADDKARQERLSELLSRGATASDRIAAGNLRDAAEGRRRANIPTGDIPAAVRGAMEADDCPAWLREFYEGEGASTEERSDTEHSRAFGDYLTRGSEDAKRRVMAHERDQKTSTGPEGGVLVPDDNRFMNQVVVSMKADMGVERVSTVFTTPHGRPIPMPTVNDTANDAYANVAEGTAATAAQNIVFGELILDAHKIGTGRLLVSTELLEDSGPMVERLIGRLLGKRIGRRVGQQLALGDGQNENLRGILTQAPVNAGAALRYSRGAGTYENIRTALDRVVRAVDIAYRTGPRASIVLSDSALGIFRTAVNTNSNFLYPSIAFIGPDNVRRMDGMRVVIDPNYPALNIGGNQPATAMITVGDHSEFYIRKVRGLRLVRNPFAEDDTDRVKFNMWHRCDSGLADTNAVRRITVQSIA